MIQAFLAVLALVSLFIQLFLFYTVFWVFQKTGGHMVPTLMWGFIVLGIISLMNSEP